MKKIMTLQIRGEEWSVACMSREEFKQEHADIPDAYAMTIVSQKRLDFILEDFEKRKVTHELIHAYYSACYLESANIKVDDVEEIMCDMVGDNIERILEQTYAIVEALIAERALQEKKVRKSAAKRRKR